MRIMPYLIIALLVSVASAQQIPHPARAKVRAYRQANEHKIVGELMDLLAIPNLASDSVNIRRNATKLVEMLQRRGAQAQLLEVAGSPPVVFGELQTPDAKRTLMFYAHYDGQAVAAMKWDTQPWQPVLPAAGLITLLLVVAGCGTKADIVIGG